MMTSIPTDTEGITTPEEEGYTRCPLCKRAYLFRDGLCPVCLWVWGIFPLHFVYAAELRKKKLEAEK